MKRPAIALHLRRGRDAERSACRYLKKQGLTYVQGNYRTPYGEIDLIMQQHDTLVFVEVRFRQNQAFGQAFETVDHRKQSKLRASAEYYLQRHRDQARQPCRFDVLGFCHDLEDSSATWIQNAF